MTRPPHRFYCPSSAPLAPGQTLRLPDGESHHLIQVLRMKPGMAAAVFDGKGGLWLGEVAPPEEKLARIILKEKLEGEGEAQVAGKARLHLATSLLKRRAMDWMIEKLCELNAASLQPLICDRTVVMPRDSEDAGAQARWERIALAAAKQSGRNIPMGFEAPMPLSDWLRRERPPSLACFAHGRPDAVGLAEWLGARAGMGLPVLACVGPEGGWTDGEADALAKAGFTAVGLGPLILRAETAALTLAAACRVML